MSSFYREGEIKTRPGMYKRYSNDSTATAASAIDGIAAIPFAGDWGPLNKVTEIGYIDYKDTIRNTYGVGKSADLLKNMMAAGLTTLYAVRVGSGGACGTLSITSSKTNAATLTLKYPGNIAVTATLRKSPSDEKVYQLIFYIGSLQVEVLEFKNHAELLKLESTYVTIKTGTASDSFDVFTSKAFEGGTNPTATVEDYEKGITALESYRYNVLTADTTDTNVISTIQAYTPSAFEAGKNIMAVIGKPSESFDNRIAMAKGANSHLVVCCGSSYINSNGDKVDDVTAVTSAAAVIAATPSNQSVTHMAMPSAVKLAEDLTNAQYIQAINNGLLVLSSSSDGIVWFDSGVNTLTSLSSLQDEGWKKIRRTKTRLELFDRLDRTVEPLIGRINNNEEGIENVIQVAQTVIDTMISENKLASGSIEVDSSKEYAADYAYFNISVVDIDSLEKIYLHYKFRYTA